MKPLLLLIFTLFTIATWAHTGVGHDKNTLKTWEIAAQNKTVEASFLMMKARVVYLEDAQHQTLKIPFDALGIKDQMYALQKHKEIEKLNTPSVSNASKSMNWSDLLKKNLWLCIWLTSLLILFTFVKLYRYKFTYKYAYYGAFIGLSLVFFSFMPKPILGTDPLFIDSAFAPFKPKVKTRWDATYFYVENLGIPSHPMMKGITAWQQQVPILQCYVGANAWSIPLNPVIAATPTPTKTNFFKGAIAVAANGIPIFNALNNRGEDSYLIGELDEYGGHCGRADDYHYHAAPLSLDSINAAILPIAFALDGFAVYAAKEPDGTAMKTLDVNHGHYLNGVYHYHGTKDYPYVVGNMVGVVKKDSTDQIIPQAQTKAIRTSGTALAGASIIDHKSTGTNAYVLTYKLNNQLYDVKYSWTNTGQFTYIWASPSGTTTNTYNGQSCSLPTDLKDIMDNNIHIKIYPNPTKTGFSLDLSSPFNVNEVKSITVLDVEGRLIQQVKGYQNFIEMPLYAEGLYFVKIQFSSTELIKKLVVNR